MTGQELRQAPCKGTFLAFAPDGRTLAAALDDGTVSFWQTTPLNQQQTLKPSILFRRLTCLAYSPDGTLLAVGGEPSTVVWDVRTGKERYRFRELPAPTCLVFAPDSKVLARAVGKEVQLWDMTKGQQLFSRPGHMGSVNSVAVLPNGKIIASAGWGDSNLRLWDAATGRPLPQSQAFQSDIRHFEFSADSQWLAISADSYEPTLQLRSMTTGEEVRRFVCPEQERFFPFFHISTDGQRLTAITSGSQGPFLTVWNPQTAEILGRRPFRRDLPYCFTPDGKSVAVGGHGTLNIEDIVTGRVQASIPGYASHRNLAFAPHGQLLAVGLNKTVEGRGWYGIVMAEVATGQEVFHIIPESQTLIAFSPDGRILALADLRGIHLRDAATGQLLFRRLWSKEILISPPMDPRWPPIASLAFFPNGRAVVTGMLDGTSLVWDLEPETWAKIDQGRNLNRKDLELLWTDLAGEARKAYPAIHTLATAPTQAIPFLKERLQPEGKVDPRQLQRLLTELDSDEVAVREKASQELAQLGEKVRPHLHQALNGQPSPEMRLRLESLLASEPSLPLRSLRALQVLEQVGTDEARDLLHRLADGVPEARLTQEAKATLHHLEQARARP